MTKIPGNDELDILHRHICQALADPKRIQIIYALAEKPRHVTALAEHLGFPQPTVSRHLRVLLQRGLVQTTRNGPAVVYELSDYRLVEILDIMRSLLKDVVERQSNALLPR
ncbi:MAG: ArsR family transcriptional regulator [Candidatus Thermofonsia bacterium]|nr:MAG: ArsR family transcriptional regulator [Candidatus Thermofonsia bacterium]